MGRAVQRSRQRPAEFSRDLLWASLMTWKEQWLEMRLGCWAEVKERAVRQRREHWLRTHGT